MSGERIPAPNCQSSAFSIISLVRAGVWGHESVRKLKSVGPKQSLSLRWVRVSTDVTDILDWWPLSHPLFPSVSSGQWFVDGMALTCWPLQYWYYSHLGHRRGSSCPALSCHICAWMEFWYFLFGCFSVVVFSLFLFPPDCVLSPLTQTHTHTPWHFHNRLCSVLSQKRWHLAPLASVNTPKWTRKSRH